MHASDSSFMGWFEFRVQITKSEVGIPIFFITTVPLYSSIRPAVRYLARILSSTSSLPSFLDQFSHTFTFDKMKPLIPSH